jgi:hypothetical protein
MFLFIRREPLKPSKIEPMKIIFSFLIGISILPITHAVAAPKIGPELEVMIPFSSETRDKFGAKLTGLGFGFGGVVPKAGGKFSPDVLVAREKKGDNKLAFYGAGLQYRRTFQRDIEASDRFVPYYGGGLGLAYGKVELPDEDVKDSKIVPSGSLFVGSSIGKSGMIEARVRTLSKVGGLDFSGISLTLGARF